jgi:hypothetical protein
MGKKILLFPDIFLLLQLQNILLCIMFKLNLIYNILKSQSRFAIVIVLISYTLLSPIARDNVFAQLSQLNHAEVIFRNVGIDSNLIPNKPFKVNATIAVADIERRHVLLSLGVPKEISLSGSAIADLGDISSGDRDRMVTWTLIPTVSGSFQFNLTAYSSSVGIGNVANNFQSNSFLFDVSIGSLKVSDVRPSVITLAGAPLTSSKVGPGDKNLPLNVSLINDGNLPLINVSATLELTEPFFWSYKQQNSTTPIETHTQTFHTGAVAPGRMDQAAYYVSVRKSANPDTYISHLRVSFSNGNQQFQKIYDLPITISPNVAVSVVSTSAKITPDYYSPINLIIENTGDVPLHALQLSPGVSPAPATTSSPAPAPSTPAASSPGPTSAGPYLSIDTPYWIGDLGIRDNKTVSLKVYIPHQKLTQEPLPLTLTYEAKGRQFTETHLIGIQVVAKPLFQISTVRVAPPISFPGDVNTRLSVNIVNAGYGIANNVSTVLILPRGLSPAFGNANTEYFGRILPGQNFTASYFLNINTNATSASYPLTVLTEYYNNKYDNGQTVSDTSFLVSPKAKFVLVGVAPSDQLYPGATNVPVRVLLKNIGTATAQTLTTKFLGGNMIPGVKTLTEVAVGNTENIGDILPGEVFTTTFIVNLDSSTRAAGQQAASTEIKWTQTQTSGTSVTTTFIQTVPITYHVSQGPTYLLYYYGISWTYVIIAAILVVLIVLFILVRRRKIHRINVYLQRTSELPPENTAGDRALDSKGGPIR